MPLYRCFCMTSDNRIITGAYFQARDVPTVLPIAEDHWRSVKGFHHVDVWLGAANLTLPHPLSHRFGAQLPMVRASA